MPAASKQIRVKIRRTGSMCFIPVPFDPRQFFGKLRVPVKVTLQGHTYRSTIFSMGGACCIPLRRSNREAAGLEGNESVTVRISLDAAERKVNVPRDLARALAATPGARARWKAMSFTQRREYAEAVTGAKKPETRQRRIANTLKALAPGGIHGHRR